MRWRAGSDSDVHANFFCDVMKLAHTYKLVYIVCTTIVDIEVNIFCSLFIAIYFYGIGCIILRL